MGVDSEGRRSCVILIMTEVTRPLLFRDLVVVLVLTVSSGGAPRMVNNLFLAVDALGMIGEEELCGRFETAQPQLSP